MKTSGRHIPGTYILPHLHKAFLWNSVQNWLGFRAII